ncbi:MAG: GtrA family protein [Clostridia bacterium]|nr:GtrA family protein [Clostridia bacterium]
MKQRIIELIKYGFWGGITTLINLALFALLDSFNVMHYIIANGIAYAIAVVINYVCNKLFVFKSNDGIPLSKRESTVEFIKFVILRIISLAVDSALFFVLVELLEDIIIINIGFITTRLIIRFILSTVIILATYIINKLFIFKSTNKKKISE